MTGPVATSGQEDARRTAYWFFVVLVTLKVLWGIWERDLGTGDTASYYLDAARWVDQGLGNIVWSSLYTVYYGGLDFLLGDARATVLAHRVLLIVASTLIAAWAAWRLLPGTLAFLVVVWWIALPIHFDTLYEVHLFGALVTFGAVLIATFESDWKLPLLIAFYAVATVLVRNENVICLAVMVAWFLYRQFRPPPENPGLPRSSRPKMVLLAAVAAACIGIFYATSHIQGPERIRAVSALKHRLNMCQVYAFGYSQRHPEWKASPWKDCDNLMKSVYGMSMPPIDEMLVRNPGAILEHFAWNLRLMPAGLEVLFFNATSFEANPDYAPVYRVPMLPTAALLGGLLLAIASLVAVRRRREALPGPLLKPGEKDFAVLMAANAVTVLAVVLTQRPRPSYLLGFGFLCVIVTAYLVKEAFPEVIARLGRRFTWLAVVAVVLIPSYAMLDLSSKQGRLSGRYGLLKPHAARICSSPRPVAMGDHGYELRNYLCRRRNPPEVLDLASAGAGGGDVATLVATLQKGKAEVVVLDATFLRHKTRIAGCNELDRALLADGWERLVLSWERDGFCDAAYAKHGAEETPRARRSY